MEQNHNNETYEPIRRSEVNEAFSLSVISDNTNMQMEVVDLAEDEESSERESVNIKRELPRSPSLEHAFERVRESMIGVESQLECPVCFEQMRPPMHMFQCRQGHVVCKVNKNQ